jgi:glucose/arabinose dehydrogenase
MVGVRAWLAIVTAALVLAAAPANAAPALEAVGTFTSPIDVASPPGDSSRLFVVERGGTVRVVKDGVTLATPFLTIPAGQLSTDGERGLIALTFAPDYATSGHLYTYSTDAGGDIRVDLWMRSPDPDVAFASRSLVIKIEHSSRNNHNGGDLHFGRDG